MPRRRRAAKIGSYHGHLHKITGEQVRIATKAEAARAKKAPDGIITVDGKPAFVERVQAKRPATRKATKARPAKKASKRVAKRTGKKAAKKKVAKKSGKKAAKKARKKAAKKAGKKAAKKGGKRGRKPSPAAEEQAAPAVCVGDECPPIGEQLTLGPNGFYVVRGGKKGT